MPTPHTSITTRSRSRSIRWRDGRSRRWATTAILTGTLLATPSIADAAPASDVVADAATRPVEELRLSCRSSVTTPTDRITDQAVEYGVGCRWSVPTVDSAAGVRLLRVIVGSDQPRTTVFATRNVEENTHLDAPLRPNHRYAYRVQALNRDGRVVASSRTVTVAVPSIDIEPLRLDCRAADGDAADTRTHIGCRWTLPAGAHARTLTLWRSVDGGARERVASFDRPFESSYRDVVSSETTRVAYAVIATDRHGSIVARSRAEIVLLDDRSPRAVGAERNGSAG